MGRPRPVVVVLVVSMFVEAVGDVRLLVLRVVVVALVSAGGAMGSGANDGPTGCSGSDADGVGDVVVSSSRLVSSRVSVTLMVGRRRVVLGTRTIGTVHSKCRVTTTLPNMKFSRWSETPTPGG